MNWPTVINNILVDKGNMNYINRFSLYYFIINLFCAFVFIRFPDISSTPILRFVIYFLFFSGFLFGVLSCFFQHKKLTISLIIFIISIIIHSFANFYQPSLKSDISFQNYVLQDTITSDFEMTQTRLYMIFFVCFLFPSISFFSLFFKTKTVDNFAKTLLFSFIFCFILNCIAAIYQGVWNLYFLTQGSGTSIEARRPPGLLDDSGVASSFFAIMSSVFFALIFHKKINIKYRSIFFIFFILNLFSGIINNSRSFFIGLFGSISIYLIFKTIDIIKNKKYKLLLNIISLAIFVTLTINFISKFKEISGLTRLQSIFQAIQNSGSFFERYTLVDAQRAVHLQIMWETIKENFFTGTGLGSFATNFYYQLSKMKQGQDINLDLPTNSYFSIISELGLPGLLLILFSLFLFIYYIIKQKNNPIFSNNIYNLIICKIFPIWAGVPFLILAFIAYMFYIPSIAYIACWILAPCLVTFIDTKKSRENLVSLFFFSLSTYFIVVAVFLAITAPPIPSFQWAKRGIPQVPMPIGTLPQPQGQTEKGKAYFSTFLNQFFGGSKMLFKPEGASEGQWFKPKTEFLILQPNYRIYIGPETRTFPTQVDITFYAKTGHTLQSRHMVSHASWVYFSVPKQKEFESCFHDVSSNIFCYYHVNVSPSWNPSFLKSIGFYIENKYINSQNLWR